jgi:hypothetical protein
MEGPNEKRLTMIRKILEIDGSQYEEGEVVKEYWVFDDDDSPAASLVVEDMNLVLREENEDSICESVEQADDTMEPLLARRRDKRIDIMAQDLPYTSSTFYEEETI